jgi:hypothetical protein
MPILPHYNEFKGRHWETGTVRNYYAYRGVKAPHTNEPYTEALLMGVSAGAVMGYFTFAVWAWRNTSNTPPTQTKVAPT